MYSFINMKIFVPTKKLDKKLQLIEAYCLGYGF